MSMSTTPRTFKDELLEIIDDITLESQWASTLVDDPELSKKTQELVAHALNEHVKIAMAAKGGTPQQGFLDGGLFLLTYGFFLGREHAKRGYATPKELDERLTMDIPDYPPTS